MDQKQLNALAVALVDRIYADRFVPAELFAAVEGAMEAGQRVWKDRQTGQVGLFGGGFGEEEAEEAPQPAQTFRVKVDGEEVEVPLDELGRIAIRKASDELVVKLREAERTAGELAALGVTAPATT